MPHSPEASFYFFDAHPHDYVGWFDVPSLPKFDLRSRRRCAAASSPVPTRSCGVGSGGSGFDGWRIDVANMTGRHGAIDVNHEVGRDVRRTIAAVGGDAWLVAEHRVRRHRRSQRRRLARRDGVHLVHPPGVAVAGPARRRR